MSYEPTTWKAGDTVTSAKLNKLEQGIANNSIPTPTVVDAGKVLGVNNSGSWALSTPSGGGSSDVVIPLYSRDELHNYTCNMTFSEILEAIQDGKCAQCLVRFESDALVDDIFSFALYRTGSEAIVYESVSISSESSNLILSKCQLVHYSDETIEETEDEFTVQTEPLPGPK